MSRPRTLALLVAVVVFVASCSGGGAGRPRIVIRGSDTMAVLLKAWAVAYPGAELEISGGGSGTGIAALGNGTCDIAASSRAMTAAERRSVTERRGRIRDEIVAIDAVALYVHRDATITAIALDDVARIYDGRISSWEPLTGERRPIARYSRENSSGTYAFFKEHAARGADFAPDVQCLVGTAAVVRAVARDRWAIGYGGIATAPGTRALAVRDAEGRLSRPTREDAIAGRYPLARPLYLYVPLSASDAVKRFVSWLDTDAARAVVERTGFFPVVLQGGAS